MKILKIKLIALTSFCAFTLSTKAIAQQGHVELNQDAKINKLLEIKKEMNKDENASDRFRIQIFSVTTDRSAANKALSNYNAEFKQWESTLLYETPNYKIWVGSFRTQLEADRALVEIKEKYPNAFILKPKIKN
ncbi:SPOR domain-containing protein [uncultured Formosa sp.]|uniref:SPOR domain-containing protein n=1 Tax=uncultured Formosa sp. TaxID=255435 RepID=UPI0026350DDB|nr:SPOR domain-containing protein [uncultured Formosa sp.]